MGLARISAVASALAALASAPTGAYAIAIPSSITVVADRDDDDLDGQPDASQAYLPPAGRADLVPLGPSFVGASLRPIQGAERARIVADGRPVPWGAAIPRGAAVQGVEPGMVNVIAVRGGSQQPLTVLVRGVSMRAGDLSDVDMARSHASLERTPPERVEGGPDSRYDDPDALRVVLELPDEQPQPGIVAVASGGPSGIELDAIPRVALVPATCHPARPGVHCLATDPLRFVVDDVDRHHTLIEARSLHAQVAGAIVVREDGNKLQAIRVLGPRASPVGPIGALQANIRPVVMRVTPGGAPAIGGNDAGAVAAVRSELALAAAIWGQCGLTFGNVESLDVHLADPPPPHLVAIGDDLGTPASGGELAMKVEGHVVTTSVPPGASVDRVADALVQALTHAGLTAVISPNARITSGVRGSTDVSVRRRDGRLAAVEPAHAGAPICTDRTLRVRIGSVDLSDGLQHFGDVDSTAGTLEERTLLKAVEDGDPRTVEVVVVPVFAGGGRIGESFIGSDLSSVRNVVLLDRAGVRARKSSLTFAHELGHVLLDMPGHPDDYGVDTPGLLMDSDASDSSPFGPRRLTVQECARMVRESGPLARTSLLSEQRLLPIAYKRQTP